MTEAWGTGLATQTTDGRVLDVLFADPQLGPAEGSPAEPQQLPWAGAEEQTAPPEAELSPSTTSGQTASTEGALQGPREDDRGTASSGQSPSTGPGQAVSDPDAQ